MTKLKLLTICIVLLTACTLQINSVEIKGNIIPVELALTAEQQREGLMFRTNLTGGMLFIYPEEAAKTFWMKNTLIPLDIIFIGKDYTIKKIFHADPCVKDPCKLYKGNAKYVLELNQNFTIQNKINVGDNVALIG